MRTLGPTLLGMATRIQLTQSAQSSGGITPARAKDAPQQRIRCRRSSFEPSHQDVQRSSSASISFILRCTRGRCGRFGLSVLLHWLSAWANGHWTAGALSHTWNRRRWGRASGVTREGLAKLTDGESIQLADRPGHGVSLRRLVFVGSEHTTSRVATRVQCHSGWYPPGCLASSETPARGPYSADGPAEV